MKETRKYFGHYKEGLIHVQWSIVASLSITHSQSITTNNRKQLHRRIGINKFSKGTFLWSSRRILRMKKQNYDIYSHINEYLCKIDLSKEGNHDKRYKKLDICLCQSSSTSCKIDHIKKLTFYDRNVEYGYGMRRCCVILPRKEAYVCVFFFIRENWSLWSWAKCDENLHVVSIIKFW